MCSIYRENCIYVQISLKYLFTYNGIQRDLVYKYWVHSIHVYKNTLTTVTAYPDKLYTVPCNLDLYIFV